MYKVILIRGENYGPCIWEHSDRLSARNRAWGLSDLHACCPVEEKGNEFIVQASWWYTR